MAKPSSQVMKKLAALITFGFIFVLAMSLWAPLYPVLALDSTGSGRTFNRLPLRLALDANIAQQIELFREKIASREAELKNRLDTFKDQRRALLALRVSDNLNMINRNRTDSMNKHLDVFSDILGKVELRATASATPSASTLASIASASAAIGTARNAVNLQAQKDYTINATSEALLQSEVKTKRDQLFTDLSAVRKVVLEARQALVNSIIATATGGKK